jgi:hypothetical protein
MKKIIELSHYGSSNHTEQYEVILTRDLHKLFSIPASSPRGLAIFRAVPITYVPQSLHTYSPMKME